MLQPADGGQSPAPGEHALAESFHPASIDELNALTVGRLGEP
jgi:hypothetical protein